MKELSALFVYDEKKKWNIQQNYNNTTSKLKYFSQHLKIILLLVNKNFISKNRGDEKWNEMSENENLLL